MLDPFGVFKSSGLVTTDADDDLVIKTTADLAQVREGVGRGSLGSYIGMETT